MIENYIKIRVLTLSSKSVFCLNKTQPNVFNRVASIVCTTRTINKENNYLKNECKLKKRDNVS